MFCLVTFGPDVVDSTDDLEEEVLPGDLKLTATLLHSASSSRQARPWTNPCQSRFPILPIQVGLGRHRRPARRDRVPRIVKQR